MTVVIVVSVHQILEGYLSILYLFHMSIDISVMSNMEPIPGWIKGMRMSVVPRAWSLLLLPDYVFSP